MTQPDDRYVCPRCGDSMWLPVAISHERICSTFPDAMKAGVAQRWDRRLR